MHMINQKDYDVTECFQNDVFAPRLTPADVRKKRLDTEAYYFEVRRARMRTRRETSSALEIVLLGRAVLLVPLELTSSLCSCRHPSL